MQIIGFVMLGFVVWYGFADGGSQRVVSAFDPHALVMVMLGSAAAVLISSSRTTAARTILYLREFIPGLRSFQRKSAAMESERGQLFALWHEGKRSAALAVAEQSTFAHIRQLAQLLLTRASTAETAKVFLEMKHSEITEWQPAINNWEMLSKLAPSFGMVGTITGMIQLFRNMNSDNLNIGSAMSLALLATLYGVAFGAGVAGPIGHFLNGLLDERLGFIERCEMSINDLVGRESR